MANARELKQRYKSVTSTGKITRTMELVSSAKLKKAQGAALAAEPYAAGLQDVMARLNAALADSPITHPLMQERESIKKVTILVETSDRGLCGAYNANIVRMAIKRIEEHRAEGREVRIIALAKKAAGTLKFMGHVPDAAHSGIIENPDYNVARDLLEPLMQDFLKGDCDLLEVVHNHFVSPARQTPMTQTLLPAGVKQDAGAEDSAALSTEYIFHPDAAGLLESLVPQSVRTSFYASILQTSAGEHAARRIAMTNASDAARDLAKAINSSYNRARQGKITQEIAEIVGAVEAMK